LFCAEIERLKAKRVIRKKNFFILHGYVTKVEIMRIEVA
jgi:hypothetical protein